MSLFFIYKFGQIVFQKNEVFDVTTVIYTFYNLIEIQLFPAEMVRSFCYETDSYYQNHIWRHKIGVWIKQ